MSCHVEPSVPPELGDKRHQWHVIQNAQGGVFPYDMRDTTPYIYRTASVSHITMCTIFIHGFANQSSNTDPIVLVVDWCVSGPNDVTQVWPLHLIWVLLPFAYPCRHAPPASYSPFGGKLQNSRLAAMHASASMHWIVGFLWQGDTARGHPCY